MSNRVSQIDDEVLVLTPALRALKIVASAELYEQLDKDFDHFKGHQLISSYNFDRSWSNWEMHPAGDEVVMLLSGHCEFLLEEADRITTHRLQHIGDYVVVPRNTWHTATVSSSCRLLFVTPGEGTQHRPR